MFIDLARRGLLIAYGTLKFEKVDQKYKKKEEEDSPGA